MAPAVLSLGTRCEFDTQNHGLLLEGTLSDGKVTVLVGIHSRSRGRAPPGDKPPESGADDRLVGRQAGGDLLTWDF